MNDNPSGLKLWREDGLEVYWLQGEDLEILKVSRREIIFVFILRKKSRLLIQNIMSTLQ